MILGNLPITFGDHFLQKGIVFESYLQLIKNSLKSKEIMWKHFLSPLTEHFVFLKTFLISWWTLNLPIPVILSNLKVNFRTNYVYNLWPIQIGLFFYCMKWINSKITWNVPKLWHLRIFYHHFPEKIRFGKTLFYNFLKKH